MSPYISPCSSRPEILDTIIADIGMGKNNYQRGLQEHDRQLALAQIADNLVNWAMKEGDHLFPAYVTEHRITRRELQSFLVLSLMWASIKKKEPRSYLLFDGMLLILKKLHQQYQNFSFLFLLAFGLLEKASEYGHEIKIYFPFVDLERRYSEQRSELDYDAAVEVWKSLNRVLPYYLPKKDKRDYRKIFFQRKAEPASNDGSPEGVLRVICQTLPDMISAIEKAKNIHLDYRQKVMQGLPAVLPDQKLEQVIQTVLKLKAAKYLPVAEKVSLHKAYVYDLTQKQVLEDAVKALLKGRLLTSRVVPAGVNDDLQLAIRLADHLPAPDAEATYEMMVCIFDLLKILYLEMDEFPSTFNRYLDSSDHLEDALEADRRWFRQDILPLVVARIMRNGFIPETREAKRQLVGEVINQELSDS